MFWGMLHWPVTLTFKCISSTLDTLVRHTCFRKREVKPTEIQGLICQWSFLGFLLVPCSRGQTIPCCSSHQERSLMLGSSLWFLLFNFFLFFLFFKSLCFISSESNHSKSGGFLTCSFVQHTLFENQWQIIQRWFLPLISWLSSWGQR